MDGKYIKATFKIFLVFVIAGFIVQATSFGIYWYNRRNFGERGVYKEKKDRCERVINREEGDLIDYSECVIFLKWLEKNSNIDKYGN